MDPYLEEPDLWPDVHARLIAGIGELLAPKLRPRYVARVEQRTFLFDQDDAAEELQVVPDVRVVERGHRHQVPPGGGTAVAQKTTTPLDVTGLVKRVGVQRFLEIRDSVGRRIITVIEVLSPSNKVESAGRRALLKKREQVSDSETSWLEIDSLRRGSRTITLKEIGEAPYIAYLDRWALDAAYDRAAYDVDVNYRVAPDSPLSRIDARWANALLREKRIRGC